MRLHPSITTDRLLETINRSHFSLGNPGICVACGEDDDNCEPDAHEYLCESCGAKAVYGVEELLIMLGEVWF